MRKSDITPDVVSCLLREQMPELARLPVKGVDVDGWDNSTFRIGAHFSARLPTDDGYVTSVAKEHRWLPVLAAELPVPIPEPVSVGAPGCGFPRRWSVYRWLEGESASAERVGDLHTFAVDVAQFLRCLQAVDARGGPAAGAHSFGRGGPLSFYEGDVLACLDAVSAQVDGEQLLDVWRHALAAPFEDEPCWFHGDVAPSNLLVRDGRLAAVIDFGTCGVGDPACDLVLAWTFLDEVSRRTFREQLGVDDGTWARGRGWALWKALLTLVDPDRNVTVRRYGWRYSAAQIIHNLTHED